MSIDDCRYSFQELATHVLPAHMERLRAAMATPLQMADFAQRGIGQRTILRRLARAGDFSGAYVLLEHNYPIYVGISRAVVQRLIQHVKGRTHYDASLAYRIASAEFSHGLERDVAMEDPAFRIEFERAQDYLKSLDVAFIEIENDVELYLFEVYCAIEFDANKWNTFRTH